MFNISSRAVERYIITRYFYNIYKVIENSKGVIENGEKIIGSEQVNEIKINLKFPFSI